MPNTPKGLTYPSSSSPVAVPADIQELATDVDGLIVPNTGGTYTGSVSFTQPPSVPTPTSGLHAVNKTYADAINADVTALETELGTNPSGTFSTVVQRLDSYTDGFNKVGNLLTLNQATGTDASGDTTGFTPAGSTLASSTAQAYQGSRSLALTATGTSPAYAIMNLSDNRLPVTARDTVTFVALARSDQASGEVARIYPLFYAGASGGSYVGVAYSPYASITNSGWTTLSVTTTVPASAAYVELYVQRYSGANGAVTYIDSLSFHRGASTTWSLPGLPVVGQSRIAVNNAVDLSGTGSPEGLVVAAPGSTYLQTDSVVDVKGWIRWIKRTGTGNTGWVVGPEADTGWRRIVAWAGDAYTEGADIAPGADWNISGAGAGYLLLRRQGTLLSLVVYGSLALVSSPTGVTPASRLCALPTGFGVGSAQTTSIKMSGDTVIALEWGGSEISRAGNANYPSGGRWLTGGASLSALTDTAWPTSLPGVAP